MEDQGEDQTTYRIPVRVSGAGPAQQAAAGDEAAAPAPDSVDDAAIEIVVDSAGDAETGADVVERRRYLEFAREKSKLEEQVRKLQADLYQSMARAQTNEAAASEKNEQLLRQQADFQNARRRWEREREEAARYAHSTLLGDLLPVMDNFELAIAVSPGPETAEDIHKGVLLIYRQLLDVLGRYDMKPLNAVGEPFDPNFHEAVMRTASSVVPTDHVVKEHRKGYFHKERLLRPAMVEVSAGGGDEVAGDETKTGANVGPDESQG